MRHQFTTGFPNARLVWPQHPRQRALPFRKENVITIMAAVPGQSLPHRAVSTIRGGGGSTSTNPPFDPSSSGGGHPRTPLRPMSSTFNSPSGLRAEDEILILELGARRIRVGFAGDAAPKGVVTFGSEQTRRVGDFRRWDAGYVDEWHKSGWGDDHELWRGDVRGLDLGLVGDRMERGLREAFNKCVKRSVPYLASTCGGLIVGLDRYLLIDSRPRRVIAVLPAGVPVPLIATTLDTLFNRFHAPSVSLMSSPVACAISSGVRSALVVDIGWAETVVTAVYEYREVQSSRTIRAGKALVENTHKLVASALGSQLAATLTEETQDGHTEHVISFEECEEIATRLAWCKPARDSTPPKQEEGLPTVTEQDESETGATMTSSDSATVSIPLRSTTPPATLAVTHEQLSTLAETTFFESERPPSSFDDDEYPLPLLIYHNLLRLPLDVRAICMARIIFTGGGSNVLGLRSRVFDEVNQLIQSRGWDPVQGKGTEAYKTNPKLRRGGSRQAINDGPTAVSSAQDSGGGGSVGHEQDGVWVDAPPDARQEPDQIEEQIRKKKDEKPRLQGQLRAIETLGAWTGASLLNLLKAPALATVERETWREQGVSGASRPGEVDHKVAQRQSMGAGGLMRSVAGANWTLGVWGYL